MHASHFRKMQTFIREASAPTKPNCMQRFFFFISGRVSSGASESGSVGEKGRIVCYPAPLLLAEAQGEATQTASYIFTITEDGEAEDG